MKNSKHGSEGQDYSTPEVTKDLLYCALLSFFIIEAGYSLKDSERQLIQETYNGKHPERSSNKRENLYQSITSITNPQSGRSSACSNRTETLSSVLCQDQDFPDAKPPPLFPGAPPVLQIENLRLVHMCEVESTILEMSFRYIYEFLIVWACFEGRYRSHSAHSTRSKSGDFVAATAPQVGGGKHWELYRGHAVEWLLGCRGELVECLVNSHRHFDFHLPNGDSVAL